MRTLKEKKADKTEVEKLRRFITVYVDVGAFAVGGDGSGIRSDIGHIYYPKYIGSDSRAVGLHGRSAVDRDQLARRAQ